jgi:hypothetical protein
MFKLSDWCLILLLWDMMQDEISKQTTSYWR